MGFKERIERIKKEQLVQAAEETAEERRRQDLKTKKRERERQKKEEKLRRAMENWRLPEIMRELNEECLEGRGTLSYSRYSDYSPELRLILEWDDDKYIYAKATAKPGGLFSKEKVKLYILGAGVVTSYNRNSLEEAFAIAFLHPRSRKADEEAEEESLRQWYSP